jgi:hypothetical protein
MENNKKNNQEQTSTTTSMTIEVKMHEKRDRSELRETKKGDITETNMVPVSHAENDFTFHVDLSAEKVKNLLKIIGEGVGDFVKEKISGEED